ncbi:Uu.00g013680.m01.CDS01 [Anthostomella pinea]|uniref:Uu.00g013680.m01.CDS01 n=1 Tax=Anthostomella pinea TaxID=933095 RepID=A0AAI8YQ69_9PEZI|nr:Uu.00g013680.m01.CDS01 [Anthostomella pinea]
MSSNQNNDTPLGLSAHIDDVNALHTKMYEATEPNRKWLRKEVDDSKKMAENIKEGLDEQKEAIDKLKEMDDFKKSSLLVKDLRHEQHGRTGTERLGERRKWVEARIRLMRWSEGGGIFWGV